MTTLFSKLFLWTNSLVLSFVLILGLVVWIQYENDDKRSLEENLTEKQSGCAALRTKRADLRRAHPVNVLIPWTDAGSSDKVLSGAIKSCDTEITEIEGKLRDLVEAKESPFISKHVKPNVPTALLALFLMLAIPIGSKFVFYYILAPMASRRPPLVIISEAKGSEHTLLKPEQASQIGAVSQSVVLTPNQELLVHTDYLQTSPLHARKRTRWLLNNKIPMSSISSGMYMLTQLECSTDDPIVVSSTKEHLSEIGIVELPEGAAFVCHPRSLVGLIYERDRPVNISRHWRLGSLQSWLTLQLRFLVFHGPGRLLIKGSRGIRMESASAARLLNQNATLGFSANLKYANTRCETFVSYWTGKEGLFHDLFTGSPGVYVYEEIATANPGGLASLPKRFVDAVLGAFGI